MSEESWRDSLPDDIRESDALKDVADVGSLAQQFIDQGKFLGNSIRVPGEDATDDARTEFRAKLMDKNTGLMEVPDFENEEAMNAVYDTLGRPKEAKDYDKPEIEGVQIDDSRFNRITQAAHKAGISKRQLKDVMSEIMAADGEIVKETQTRRDEGVKQLRDDWGPAYDKKIATVAKLAELTEAPSGLVDAIKAGNVDSDTVRWLDKLSSQLGGEASEMVNQANGGDGAVTKVEARERSQEILQQLTDMDHSDPRYDDLMKKRVGYMDIAYPG